MKFNRWKNKQFDRIYINGVSNDALDKIYVEPLTNPEIKGFALKMTNRCYQISASRREIFESDIFNMLSYMKVDTYKELCEKIKQ